MLTGLALRSKQHWGYDDAFIDACRAELTLTSETLERAVVTVAEDGPRILGFSVLGGDAPEVEVEWLFVEPVDIGRGVGRALWDRAVSAATELGAEGIRVESDPHAVCFYERVGAVQIGTVASGSITGRRNPLMRFDVAAHRRGARP